MSELIRLRTEQFELSVWCNDISLRQTVYFEMLRKRNGRVAGCEIRLIPAIELQDFESDVAIDLDVAGTLKTDKIQLDEPLFFENIQYQFDLIFNHEKIENAWLSHKLNELNHGFRFIPSRSFKNGIFPARLTGVINTRNDIGWLTLPFRYIKDGEEYSQAISFEVLSTKLDLHHDLPIMYKYIDSVYPLWRFSLVEKTEQSASKGDKGNFPLLWLANFSELRRQFETSLKVISSVPHSRLQKKISYSKPEKLKGRVNNRLQEQIQEDFVSGQFSNSYKISKKFLSVDTPENRYIKMIVETCRSKLSIIFDSLNKSDELQHSQRLSKEFIDEISSWQAPLIKMQTQSFLKDVGEFRGLQRESLVLQQKTGYSTIYRIWQELQYYLNAFVNQTTVSMKSIAEIYEVWCFLMLRRVLIEKLGFVENGVQRELIINGALEYQLKDGLAGAFNFRRTDGLQAKLIHEPVFRANGSLVRSYVVTQKPDILLEVTFPNGNKCIWLFDAKYRIKTQKERFDKENIDETDYAPDDAINQMHRYRDALIQINASGLGIKSRPVFGSFVLYPGNFDQSLDLNPYAKAIDEVGVGAFALLPHSEMRYGCQWLYEYLVKHIGADSERPQYSYNEFYLQEPTRIPFHGMKQSYHSDLVLTVSLVNESDEYVDQLFAGITRNFKLVSEILPFKGNQHILDEIRFIGLAIPSSSNSCSITRLWSVQSINLVSAIDGGEISMEGSDSICYEFILGTSLNLNAPIEGVPVLQKDSIRLTTLSRFDGVNEFEKLVAVYS